MEYHHLKNNSGTIAVDVKTIDRKRKKNPIPREITLRKISVTL